MNTIEIRIAAPAARREELIAALSELPTTGLLEEDDLLALYLPVDEWTAERQRSVGEIVSGLPECRLEAERTIAETNWNEEWERSIKPIEAGGFTIAPTWHDLPESDRLLRIDPKMSFGTGYHPTTRLVLRLMSDYVEEGDRLLDAGTGTGVLAIAAARLGAAQVTAFDIDPWSQENAVENIERNGVQDHVRFVPGSIEKVQECGPLDGALANINRSVLLDLLPRFAQRLRPDGYCILSGLLDTDAPLMRGLLEEHGFRVDREEREADWWAVAARFVPTEPEAGTSE